LILTESPSLNKNSLIIVIIDFNRYPGTYCLMQDRCFICSNFKIWKRFTSKLESPPLTYTFILWVLMRMCYHSLLIC